MAYLFTITNSLQGLFIFVFNCLTNEKVRAEYRKLLAAINLKPVCIDSSPSKSADTSRDQMPSSSLSPEHRSSLYVNNSNIPSAPKDQSIVNMFPVTNSVNNEPLISGTSGLAPNGLNMTAMMPSVTESPKTRRMNQKYYLTDDSSDYGCKRLQNRSHKQSCRDLYSLRAAGHMASHSPNFIEHIYECIDEDPYVAKLLLPAIQRSLDGQHIRTLSDSSRHSDNRPLISCSTSSPRGHNFHIQGPNTGLSASELGLRPVLTCASLTGSHLPAIVKDNTNNKTTIICSNQLSNQLSSQISSQPTVAMLNGNNQVICCTLNDHQLCDHNNQAINDHLRQQYLLTNSMNNLNMNCLPSKNRHLSSDC